MLASMEAREQREEAREMKLTEVLDKISSRLDKLELSNPIAPSVEIGANSGIDLNPVASMGIDTQNPPPLFSVSEKGKTHINPNPAPQSSTHQFGTFQIVPPRKPTPQFPLRS
ncbi:hypothetical protein Dimus_039495 [Dionaea muscipula]